MSDGESEQTLRDATSDVLSLEVPTDARLGRSRLRRSYRGLHGLLGRLGRTTSLACSAAGMNWLRSFGVQSSGWSMASGEAILTEPVSLTLRAACRRTGAERAPSRLGRAARPHCCGGAWGLSEGWRMPPDAGGRATSAADRTASPPKSGGRSIVGGGKNGGVGGNNR